MTQDSSSLAAGTLGAGVVGCILTTDELLDAAAAAAIARGLPATSLHVGASDPARAAAAAQRLGIAADLDAADPLGRFLETGGTARAAVDRGGVIGAAVGVVVGGAIGLSPYTALQVPGAPRVLGDVALWLVLGAIAGTVLAAALAPQPSTHAAFRLIDGMQEGAYALVLEAPPARLDEMRSLLASLGGTGLSPG